MRSDLDCKISIDIAYTSRPICPTTIYRHVVRIDYVVYRYITVGYFLCVKTQHGSQDRGEHFRHLLSYIHVNHNTPQACNSDRALDVNRRAVDANRAYEKRPQSGASE